MSRRRIFLLGLWLLLPALLWGAKIGDLTDVNWQDQALRFLSFQDASVRYVVVGCGLLGLSCGLMGSFILVRKLSLMGDTLSHAVLPGVALGFMWNMTKDPLAIFVGAVVVGLIGTLLTNLVRRTTLLKEDAALGLVLGGFYGAGIMLVRMVQNLPEGNKAGLDKFFFGQAAALGQGDVVLIATVTGLAVLLVLLCYKELLATSFDMDFARALGLPAGVFHYLVMLLLTFAVVVSLQAVGIVLVSALLITPAATAYLLTDRMHRMLWLAAAFGLVSGILGAFLSFLENSLPTGPLIVLSATLVFIVAFLFGPHHGVVPRLVRRFHRDRKIQRENTLKAIFQVRENADFAHAAVTLGELAQRRNQSLNDAEHDVRQLLQAGLATFDASQAGGMVDQRRLMLTPKGWEEACRIVRNHRLWELYLTHAASIQSDHVHDDADIIEHILGDDVVRQLERRLDYPSRDPHGKLIPGRQDLDPHPHTH
ncbi:MAG: metal ABC transporter permease [Verrucomicrobiota bacterium JB022]|nr:metal ABC transporter permease [Verrucomicrobiota bacterium JB022]